MTTSTICLCLSGRELCVKVLKPLDDSSRHPSSALSRQVRYEPAPNGHPWKSPSFRREQMDIDTYLTTLSKGLLVQPGLKERIEISIGHLRQNLWGVFQERLQDVAVFGSFDRGTFIDADPLSDVDVLVLFKQREFQPETYLKRIRAMCESKYPRSQVFQDHPTVVIDMDHIRFELVPAYRPSARTTKIPAPRSKELKWIDTDPAAAKKALLEKDQRNKGHILPLVRIMKYWDHLNDHPFASFELERITRNKLYNSRSLSDSWFEITEKLQEYASTVHQTRAVTALLQKRKRLRALQTNALIEYIVQEMGTVLPIP
mgnify:CR=1 FL=1